MEPLFRFDRIFPYALPPVLTALVCLFLALLTIKAGKHNRENKLFTILCLLLLIYNVDFILHILLISKQTALLVSRWSFAPLIFSLPLCVQFIHQVLGLKQRKKLEWFLYGYSVLLLSTTQTNFFISEGYEYYFGHFPKIEWGFILFSGASTLAGIYYVFLLIFAYRRATLHEFKRKIIYIFMGFPVGWGIIGFNFFAYAGFELYPPGTYGFIPLSFLAYGMIQHALLDTSQSFLRKGYWGNLLSYVVLFPLLAATLFLLTSDAVNLHKVSSFIGKLYPYGIAPLLSLLVSMGLSAFCLRKGLRRVNTILFGLICLLWGGLCLERVLGFFILLEYAEITLRFAKTSHFLFVNQLGLFLHFIYITIKHPGRKVVMFFYLVGFLLMMTTQTHFYFQEDMYRYPFGIMPMGNWGVVFLAIFGGMGTLWGSALLAREGLRERDVSRRTQLFFIFVGLVLSAFLFLGNMPSVLGVSLIPLGDFSFIPLIIMAYGIFRHDVLKINIYAKKRFFAVGVKIALITGYGGSLPMILWTVEGLDSSYIFSRIVPLGIPPLLSFLCCLFLSALATKLAQNQKGALLFSLVCILYSWLNLDIFLSVLIMDPQRALQVMRWGQFFFVFIVSLILHFTFIITYQQKRWYLVYTAYFLSGIFAPLSQTDYYFTGLYTYFWGYFPQAGLAFIPLCLYFLVCALYSGWLLIIEYLTTNSRFQKHRIRYILVGFSLITMLTLGDVPGVYGFEIYPLGNFSFLPFLVLAYGLFRQNIRDAMQSVRILVFWTGVLLALWGMSSFIQTIFSPQNTLFQLWSFVLTTLLFYPPIKSSWNAILDLFVRNPTDDFEFQFLRLTDELSQIHHIAELYQTVSRLLIKEFFSSRCALLFFDNNHKNFYGWEIWNKQFGIFERDIDVPEGEHEVTLLPNESLVLLFNIEQTLITQTQLEEGVLERDIPLAITERLLEAEIIQSIFFQDQLTCLILLDAKIDGAPYSKDEAAFLHQLGMVLGPHIEHAKLLQDLENQVRQRTSQLEESNEIIQRQNQVFQSLLEISASLHKMHELEQFLLYTLNQLHALFDRWGFGLVVHGERPEIVSFVSFKKITEPEQQLILANAAKLLEPKAPEMLTEITQRTLLPEDLSREENQATKWLLLPMRGREHRLVGNLLIKGPELDQQSIKTITLFLEQVAAVAENKLLTQELEKIANTDGLTGAYNRLYYDRELERIIQQVCNFPNIYFSILLIDVNGLKRVNDIFGHGYGDAMIVMVAKLLMSVCRKTDMVVRLGGDEFVVLSPSTGYQNAHRLLKRIREKEKETFMECTLENGEKERVPIRVSIGLASSEDTPPLEVSKKADQRMYADKEAYYAHRERYR
ncbi:diguanylate cyclase [Deltaproteobacteria bacterium TL4]